MTIIGVDTGSRSLREADHLIHALADRFSGLVACTHLIRGARPHVAVSLEFSGPWADVVELDAGVAVGAERSGPDDLSAGAAEAVAQRLSGVGRAVLFPGSDGLRGVVGVGDVLERSSIARLQVIGGAEQPGPDDVVDTRDHVRPEWQVGELVLAVTPAGPGRYAPFEVPNPTPCCADHD